MTDASTLIRASVKAGIDAFKPPGKGLKGWLPPSVTTQAACSGPGAISHAESRAELPDMGVNALDAEGVQPNVQTPSTDHLHQVAQAIAARSVIVPTRSLGPAHQERIAQHLISLSAHDRYLRFGYQASDEQIRRYVDGIDFVQDEVFGIYNRKLILIAVAHLAFRRESDCRQCAEFGVSVLPSARDRGYGSRLFERTLIHARNEGVRMLFIHALTENAPMLAIARKHGATMERHGSETEAFLRLAPADWESRLEEAVEDSVAEIDFELKLQARRFWTALKEAAK